MFPDVFSENGMTKENFQLRFLFLDREPWAGVWTEYMRSMRIERGLYSTKTIMNTISPEII